MEDFMIVNKNEQVVQGLPIGRINNLENRVKTLETTGGGAVDSVNGYTGVVVLTKTDLSLGNVDNTSDANKPISTATQTALDGKVDENVSITGATKTKITYDSKGLVTSGADATTADIADSSNKRYVTDAQLTVIGNTSGTNTGDNATNSQYSGLATSKQDTLVSGTNIKTINGNSLLGSGDLTVGGGVSDGDKGDITVSASGATWTIDNGAVSLAKQADMATASVVYRKTAGSGAPEVQTLSTLKTDLGLTGTNSGDQTSIVGITGTKAQFDAAVTDGNFLYVGDVTQYTDELAQDAVGGMVDTTLVYTDGTPLLSRAALTGAITASAGSNTTSLGSFTKSQLSTAVSDGDVLFVGDVTTNATHTGDVTGSTALTIDPTAITGKTLVTAVGTDYILISDTSDSGNLKKALASDLAGSGGVSDGDKGDITVSSSGTVWTIDSGVVTPAKTSITGTPDGSKFLRDDWTWQAPPGGGSGLTQPQVLTRVSMRF